MHVMNYFVISRIPFYIFPPGEGSDADKKVGKIVKIWSGLLKEAVTEADTFEVCVCLSVCLCVCVSGVV